MAIKYTLDDVLDFLNHAGDKSLMPAASAQALAVATRNVLGVLEDEEQKNLESIDVESIIKRFNNKRSRDFSPASLKEYGRRVRKALDLYQQWRNDPADLSVKTRAPKRTRKESQSESFEKESSRAHLPTVAAKAGAYQSSFPVGSGRVITLINIPDDLTSSEADKLAQFVRLLAVD